MQQQNRMRFTFTYPKVNYLCFLILAKSSNRKKIRKLFVRLILLKIHF